MAYLLRRPCIKVRNFYNVCLCQIFQNLNISVCFCQVTEKHFFSYYQLYPGSQRFAPCGKHWELCTKTK